MSELVAPRQGGVGAEAKLETEHHMLGGLQPEAGLLEQPPVRREECELTLGLTVSQASSITSNCNNNLDVTTRIYKPDEHEAEGDADH